MSTSNDSELWPGKRQPVARRRDDEDHMMRWPGKRARTARRLAELAPAAADAVASSADASADVRDVAERVRDAAERVLHAVNGGDPDEVARTTEALGVHLARLAPGDPEASAAAAWADFALARVALLAGDRSIARSRLETAAAENRPAPIRIEAMLALTDESLARGDVESALGWARKAMTALDVDLDAEIERLAPSSPSLVELLREWRAGSG